MSLDLDKMAENFDKALDDLDKMSPEELEEYFPKDKTPKGWVSIEDALPHWLAMDVARGCTMYVVKDKDGNEYESGVSDHSTWYYFAKERGITHWWNPERMNVIVLEGGITAKEVNECTLPECKMDELDANAHPEFSERLQMEWDNYHKAENKLRTFDIYNKMYLGQDAKTGEDMYGGFYSGIEYRAETLPSGKIKILGYE